MLRATSNKLSSEYDRIVQLVRASSFVHVDETEFKVGKEKHWLWTFTNNTETVFTMRKNRS